jgi:hypothetical protein
MANPRTNLPIYGLSVYGQMEILDATNYNTVVFISHNSDFFLSCEHDEINQFILWENQ